MTPLERVMAAFPVAPRRSGSGWAAKCPAHDDRQASLTIGEGQDGRALVSCHAGCPAESVVALLGLTMADLFAEHDRPVVAPTITRHEIRDADGELVAIHERTDSPDGKRFRWLRPDGAVGLGGTPAASLPLYGAEKVAGWPDGKPITLTEGERAADALRTARRRALGTVTGAAGVPSAASLAVLAGRDVILWPDADAPGREHMHRIATALEGVARSVAWLELPEVPKGHDAADLLGLTEDPIAALREAAVYIGKVPEIVSAQPPAPLGRKQSGGFRTAAELADELPEAVEWIVSPWVAAGAITELDGRPKAAGKSTLLFWMVRATLDGGPFLGLPTARTPIVYLTEQPPASLRATLARTGLLERTDLHLLLWRDVRGLPWPEIVGLAVAKCQEAGARLLVIDTLPQFAGLRGDAENDAGSALEALIPLQAAAADGLAVVIARHDRKGGGEVGDSGRGSSAFTGAVDVVLALRRADGQNRPTLRVLSALSRFDDTPPEVVIDLTPDGYVALGSTEAVALAEARDGILEHLTGQAVTVDDLVALTGSTRSSVQRALDGLAFDGKAERTGRGRKGDPYRFALPPNHSVDLLSAQPKGLAVGQKEIPASSTADQTILAAAQRLFGSTVA